MLGALLDAQGGPSLDCAAGLAQVMVTRAFRNVDTSAALVSRINALRPGRGRRWSVSSGQRRRGDLRRVVRRSTPRPAAGAGTRRSTAGARPGHREVLRRLTVGRRHPWPTAYRRRRTPAGSTGPAPDDRGSPGQHRHRGPERHHRGERGEGVPSRAPAVGDRPAPDRGQPVGGAGSGATASSRIPLMSFIERPPRRRMDCVRSAGEGPAGLHPHAVACEQPRRVAVSAIERSST